ASKAEKPKVNDPFGLDIPLLVTTKTCPNCKVAISMLEKAGVAYNKVLAEDVRELVDRYEIKQAPTLIARKDDKIEILTGVPAIKSFI
ncbi:MAG: hypothetical protein IJZ89_01460, partial [Clostridia bacterium]|nr:hypothetical protein [Clostridia bacterium]